MLCHGCWTFSVVSQLESENRNDNFLFGLKIEKSWNSLETRLVDKIFCGCKFKSAVTILFKIYRVLLPNIFKDWFLSKKRVWELMREIFPNVIFAPKILLGSKENNSRYLGIFKTVYIEYFLKDVPVCGDNFSKIAEEKCVFMNLKTSVKRSDHWWESSFKR